MKRLLLWITAFVICSASGAADAFPGKERNRDVLVVTGKDFSLQVKEPPGWKGDTCPASKYQANLIIQGKGIRRLESTFFAVRVNSKTDENIDKDLKADMDIYRKSFPDVKFDVLDLKHPYYKSAARLFYVNGDFYEYVCYLNPGKKSPFLLSVSLSKQKQPASGKELQALTKIVESVEISNLAHRDNQASMEIGL